MMAERMLNTRRRVSGPMARARSSMMKSCTAWGAISCRVLEAASSARMSGLVMLVESWRRASSSQRRVGPGEHRSGCCSVNHIW